MQLFAFLMQAIKIDCMYSARTMFSIAVLLNFFQFVFRAAIFQKVADLITGKFRIPSLAATMVGQVSKSQRKQ